MAYTPNPPPINPDIVSLMQYMQFEFRRISEEFRTPDITQAKFSTHYADDILKPRDGDTVFFLPNGTQTKNGMYTYRDGLWRLLG